MAQITKTSLILQYLERIKELTKEFGLIDPDITADDKIIFYCGLIAEQLRTRRKPRTKPNYKIKPKR